MKITIEVKDSNGILLKRFDLEVPASAGSNADDAGITDPIDIALLMVAPECCPYDCDHCRST